MSPKEIEQRIVEMFEENYQSLRLSGGQALNDYIKQLALKQIIAYYRKLRNIAENVSETEVKLTLPNQKTSKGNKFNIEGVVDIVREDKEVWMYDLKTHEANYIRENPQFYANQLNVYAHIWENLRNNHLDHTAIISTALPQKVNSALTTGDDADIELAFNEWNPIVDIEYNQENVEETIDEFANVVDSIEDRKFTAPALSKLKRTELGTNVQFATYVCRNCDARFSCSSYREYIKQSEARSQSDFWKYLEETADPETNEERIVANLDNEMVEE